MLLKGNSSNYNNNNTILSYFIDSNCSPFTSKHNWQCLSVSSSLSGHESVWKVVLLTAQSTKHAGMTYTKLACSLTDWFLCASIECFQNPSWCCCISDQCYCEVSQEVFWIHPISCSHFHHFSTIDGCNDMLKSRLAHLMASRSLILKIFCISEDYRR